MADLTEAEKEALGNLSDDEKAFLAAFEEGKPDDDAGTGEGAGEATGETSGADGESASESEASGAGDEGTGQEGEGGDNQPEQVEIESITVGDREVPIAEVEALLEFQNWATQNPDKMKAFGQYINGEAEFVIRQQQEEAAAAAAKEQEEQIDWDLVDPAFKRAWEAQQAQLQELNQRIEQTQGPIQAWQQQQMSEVARQAEDQITKATVQVREKLSLDLSQEEIDELHAETARLNILPGLRQSIADPTEAVATALELAVYKTPKFRDKIVGAQVATERAKDKRQLAGIVGGDTGSERGGLQSPPGDTEVKKMSPEDRKKAMAAEIAESMRGTP